MITGIVASGCGCQQHVIIWCSCIHVVHMCILLHYVLDYIYSMNGVNQHAKPVTVGQPPMNTPVGKCSLNAVKE